MWLDTQDARSRDRNPSNFTLDCVSDHSSTKRTTLAKEILRYFYFLETAAAAFVYIFYTLSATRVLNSFEELCITLAVAGNSFARELNPHGGAYIYIYIYSTSVKKNKMLYQAYIYIYIYIYIRPQLKKIKYCTKQKRLMVVKMTQMVIVYIVTFLTSNVIYSETFDSWQFIDIGKRRHI